MVFGKEEMTFIPLGGAEQFGVNLNVYGTKGKLLAVDCGIGFADERFPGIDILLPDPAYLEERKDSLTALIVTHAHEDHVGAVPYIWPRLRCPIYCTAFTAAVLRKKFEEHTACKDAVIHIVKPGDTIKPGPFKATFIPVAHSIPQACSVLIETKAGRVLHSGDWNLDPAPVAGSKTEAAAFKDAGSKGDIVYIGDSTNAEVDGRSGSESDVEAGLKQVFKTCRKKIIVTIFSSNIGRIHSICRAAEACGRSVAVVGRSLHSMIGCAKDCGYLRDIQDFVTEEDITHLPDERIVVIATGSQGEPRAQLSRIARGEHPTLRLAPGDTVVYSSRAIPGNEKEIIAVQNVLAAAGVHIITPRRVAQTIHVSGHPARDEIRDMLSWVKPQAMVAVHGERVMIEAHAKLAGECGVKNAIVPNNGAVIRLFPGPAEVIDHVATGLLAVEPGRVINADHVSINQRRKLQFSGTVHVTLVMDTRGDLLSDPKISCVGLHDPDSEEGASFESEIAAEVEDILADMEREELRNDSYIAEEVRVGVRRLVMHLIRIKPITSVHVVRV